MSPIFEGTLTALVTPFHSDGSIDLATLAELVEWQIDAGIEGLVPCGSTGESATLSHEEHNQVVRHVVEVAAGRVPVVAGTGSNSTREACAFTREARSAGADGALLISPYYNKPSQEGIYLHYREVAESSGMPMLIYNVPGRTASRIEPETSARLSQIECIVGLKEAGGDLAKTAETLAAVAPGFSVLSGDDVLTLPMLTLGARGVISTAANVVPDAMSRITHCVRSGDFEGARKTHFELLDLMQVLFIESNPIPVKAALEIMGRIPTGRLRLPLTDIQKANRDRLETVLDALGLVAR